MSKRKKTGFPQDLWVIEHIDRMNPADSFESEPMPREQAEAEFAAQTANGTRNVATDKHCLGYYALRQKA